MKTEVDEIVEALYSLYGENVVSINLSAHQAAADRLGERIYQGVKFGRVKMHGTEMIVVPYREFEFFGRTQYSQDCYSCRSKIQRGDPVWFRTNRAGERTMAFHEECFERERSGARQGELFAALKADGLTAK